jgi:hypothetical protein
LPGSKSSFAHSRQSALIGRPFQRLPCMDEVDADGCCHAPPSVSRAKPERPT